MSRVKRKKNKKLSEMVDMKLKKSHKKGLILLQPGAIIAVPGSKVKWYIDNRIAIKHEVYVGPSPDIKKDG